MRYVRSTTRAWHNLVSMRDDGKAVTECDRIVKVTATTDDIAVVAAENHRVCLECPDTATAAWKVRHG